MGWQEAEGGGELIWQLWAKKRRMEEEEERNREGGTKGRSFGKVNLFHEPSFTTVHVFSWDLKVFGPHETSLSEAQS